MEMELDSQVKTVMIIIREMVMDVLLTVSLKLDSNVFNILQIQ